MFRSRSFCPKTRKWGHKYDKDTHRCECGAWERGFAPKKAHVRPRAECQICERVQALETGGCLGHHGYTRPGYGFIQGDCFGVAFRPYPATDALEEYKVVLERLIEARRQSLAGLPTIEEFDYTVNKGRREKEEVVKIKRGDQARLHGWHWLPSFDDMVESRRRALEMDIRQATEEIQRVVKRIEKAKSIN